jgi:hypothetical protein
MHLEVVGTNGFRAVSFKENVSACAESENGPKRVKSVNLANIEAQHNCQTNVTDRPALLYHAAGYIAFVRKWRCGSFASIFSTFVACAKQRV